MSTKMNALTRVSLCAVLLVAGNACILSLAATPAATPEAGAPAPTADPGEPEASVPTAEPTPTLTPEPSATQTHTPTVEPVTLTAGQNLSCVTGPHWILYEWVARVEEGQIATLLARAAPDYPDYFFARTSSGSECWIFGGSSAIRGDPALLPVREAPPLPQVTYQIDNQTGLSVCAVYIRGKNETVWGASRLGMGNILAGAAYNLTLTAGFYDVKILECKASEVLYEEHDRAIGSDAGYRYTLLKNEANVFVYNDLGVNLCGLSYKRSGDAAWRILHSIEDGILAPGEGETVRLLVGQYDFRFARCAGPVSVASGITILPSTTRFPDPDA